MENPGTPKPFRHFQPPQSRSWRVKVKETTSCKNRIQFLARKVAASRFDKPGSGLFEVRMDEAGRDCSGHIGKLCGFYLLNWSGAKNIQAVGQAESTACGIEFSVRGVLTTSLEMST